MNDKKIIDTKANAIESIIAEFDWDDSHLVDEVASMMYDYRQTEIDELQKKIKKLELDLKEMTENYEDTLKPDYERY